MRLTQEQMDNLDYGRGYLAGYEDAFAEVERIMLECFRGDKNVSKDDKRRKK